MPSALLSPEAQLLLLVAGSTNDAAIRTAAARDLDWAKLIAIAERQKATAVVWRRLSAIAEGSIPADAATQLRRLAMVSDFKMQHLEDRLLRALDAFAAAGIDSLLLKGAALVYSIYGSFTERPMGDIDLLVDARRAEEARALLLSQGWTWAVDELPEASYDGHHHLPPLDDTQVTGLSLEVHTGLFISTHPFRFSASDLWADARTVYVKGRAVRVPSLVHQLLHTCLHFAWSHEMQVGAWRAFRDVSALAASGQVDWDAFVALAEATRGGTSCYWTLRLARSLSGVDVPAPVLARLRPPVPEPVLRLLDQHFALHPLLAEHVCPSVRLARAMWQLAILPGRSGHGGARPWDADEGRFQPMAEARAARVGASGNGKRPSMKVAHDWTQYLRTILRARLVSW